MSANPATPSPNAPTPPALPNNPPGLSALAYRVGTHAYFKAEMIKALAGGPLKPLTGAKDDDPSRALMDAWAAALDVLTFYQERIANEGFLRTLTEARSAQELGRAVGYELNPGIAAETYVAFTLDDTPGAPEKVTLDAGTRLQSVPGPGEQAHVFETVETIEARPEWNALKPALTQYQVPQKGDTSVYLAGISTGLKAGDGILIVGKERYGDPTSERWDFRRVKTVTPDGPNNRTRVTWDKPLGHDHPHVDPTVEAAEFHAFRLRAALFGHNAPDWRSIPESMKAEFAGNAAGLAGARAGATLPETTNWEAAADNSLRVHVDTTAAGFSPASKVLYFTSIGGQTDHWELGGATAIYQSSPSGFDLYLWSKSGQTLSPVHAKERKWCVEWIGIELEANAASFNQWPGFTLREVSGADNTIELDAAYPQIRPGGWLVLAQPHYEELYGVDQTVEDARTNFAISSQTTRVTLKGENLAQFNNQLRATLVFAQSEKLNLAEAPISAGIAADALSILLAAPVAGLERGRVLLVSGEEESSGAPVADRVVLDRLSSDGRSLSLNPAQPLRHAYRRDSLKIYANVAHATHGETRTEVLGSADAGQAFQPFPLRQAPLTFVPAATPSGGADTLKVRVNNVLWDEAPALYGAGPRDRVYTARQGAGGKFVIQFGDGVSGARPPRGDENVSATYRVGLGAAGNVGAGQVRVLLSRLLGVRGATNPLPATGGVDPEGADSARLNVPYQVLTLDRIVTLRDYEDFARAFGGVGKARADWLRHKPSGVISVTVVDSHGHALDDDTRGRLEKAMKAAHDPAQYFELVTTQALRFSVHTRVQLDPHVHADQALNAARLALRRAFELTRREFGQAVTESEILGLLQSVDGVVAAAVVTPYPAASGHAGWGADRQLTAQPNELWLLAESLTNVVVDPVADLSGAAAQGESA